MVDNSTTLKVGVYNISIFTATFRVVLLSTVQNGSLGFRTVDNSTTLKLGDEYSALYSALRPATMMNTLH